MASGSQPKKVSILPSPAANSDQKDLVTDSIATGVMFALILTVGQRAIGFFRGLLFCRFMDEQQLGQWSLIWSFLMLLVPLAVLGLPGCFGRYSEYYRQRGQLGYFVKRIAMWATGLTLGLATAMVVFPSQFSHLVFRSTEFTSIVYSMAFCIVMVSVSNFMISLMESLRQVRLVTMMRFLTGILFATVGLGLAVFMEDAAIGATIGFGVSSLVGVIPGLWVLYKYRDTLSNTGEFLRHSTMWSRLAPFAAWLWVSNFFNNCFELSDRYMLLYCSPVSADLAQGLVGQYHSGRTIPLVLISLSAMLGGVLLPYMAAHWEKDEKEEACDQLRWTTKLMSIAFTLVGVAIVIAAPFIFDTLLQGRYEEGLSVLPMTLVYCIWFGLYTVGQDYLWVAEKGKYTALSLFIGLLMNLLLNWLLIPHMGVSGAVLATTISNALLVSLIYGFNHYFGCKSDFGLWACACLPLVLLMPVGLSIAMCLCVSVADWKTNCIFRDHEKQEILGLVKGLLNRIGNR